MCCPLLDYGMVPLCRHLNRRAYGRIGLLSVENKQEPKIVCHLRTMRAAPLNQKQ